MNYLTIKNNFNSKQNWLWLTCETTDRYDEQYANEIYEPCNSIINLRKKMKFITKR